VARFRFALPWLAALANLLATPAVAQINGPAQPDLKFAANAVVTPTAMSCSQQPQALVVPREMLAQARLKARLMTLLRESLYDEAKGIVNVTREQEIRKLAAKLKTGKLD
jgi:hypothetical protein